MKITFNITLYHGTSSNNTDSIIKNGFNKESISCGTQNKEWAEGFGDTLLSFKYPYTIKLIDLFWFIKEYGDIVVCVSGFKPKKTLINK